MRATPLLVAAFLIAVPTAALGQEVYQRAVIIDLSSRRANQTAERAVTINNTALIGRLSALAGDTILTESGTALVTAAQSQKVGHRWESRPGDRIAVFVFHDTGTVARVRFTEEARQTRLAADITTLAQLALQIATGRRAELVDSLPKPSVIVTAGFSHAGSPYVGLVWTKNDRVDDQGNRAGDRRYGSGEFVWGVSLNLDKALGWAGGGK